MKTDLRERLRDELKSRQKSNQAYSLRAFAQSLQLSPAQLSQIISGKRNVTPKVFDQIARRLNFSPFERRRLFEGTVARDRQAGEEKRSFQLREDQFRLISDWHHFAILSLAKLKGAKNDPAWVAKRLNIKFYEAKEALLRLQRLDILDSGPCLSQKTDPLRIASGVPSEAIRKYHRQILALAEEKITETPLEARDFSAMTMAIDPKNIPLAKKAIESFQEEMVSLLEKGNCQAVYTFSCQLFPVTEALDERTPR
ncbi:MAG: TIGR02147 family protein [Bdellovibrionaceae bacterium]|nr:TIGR02147 family protein [Pseudobdellovibrionaceae bacterium]MBX3034115.1 TIGR02147 family protein [Pseudobdellovibrionaceae bacterium]